MRTGFRALLAASVFAVSIGINPAPGADKPQWAMNATIIEACSCPMFCQCYFNTAPAAPGGHHGHGEGEHFCKFNNAYRVNSGYFNDVKLDGATFWLYGDLGGDFSKGQMNWAVLTFDPGVKPEQREAIQKIVGHVYPAQWKSFSVAPDAKIEWTADKDKANAKLDEGKIAEIALKRYPGNTDAPIVIQNLKYWGAPRNDGFILMPNEIQTVRKAPQSQKPYEFKGTNGFMITFDINANDVKK